MYLMVTVYPTGNCAIWDDYGNKCIYLGYTEREAIRRFKREYGYRYKRGVEILHI